MPRRNSFGATSMPVFSEFKFVSAITNTGSTTSYCSPETYPPSSPTLHKTECVCHDNPAATMLAQPVTIERLQKTNHELLLIITTPIRLLCIIICALAEAIYRTVINIGIIHTTISRVFLASITNSVPTPSITYITITPTFYDFRN